MNEITLYTQIESPIGELLLFGGEHSLQGLYMDRRPLDSWKRADEPFADARAQLGEYFAGQRSEFDIELDLRGSTFQRTVWDALLEIPYGETRSYGEIARMIGRPAAARAVGAANGANPLPPIIPCHRLVGMDGSLTGYGGGLETKRWLLDFERGTE